MILETKTDTLILEEGEAQESTKMEIDDDSHIFLMRMLSKFYSDGIGSLIRETCSNALDSHRECGIDEPIIVSFKQNKDGNYEFSVQDFGCGIDDQDITNIISKYGKSTKRLSVNQLGAFGLGFKSPLAYTSSFYFVGRKGGIERKWMLYESDDESNKIDQLYESPTTERNGVKVIVSVKYGDRGEFQRKIKEQLAYFENVYFDCGREISNEDVKIVRNDHFQWSSLAENDRIHICLDNVYYPIDFDKLGINPLYFPVGLRFSLADGLFPVPNREQLKYTKEAKEVILAKLKEVANYFVSKYNESIKDTDDIIAVLSYYLSTTRYIPHFNGKEKLDVRDLENYSDISFIAPKLNNTKYLDMNRVNYIKDYLFYEYNIKHTYNNGRFSSEKASSWRRLNYSNIFDKTYVFTEMSILKKKYLRDILGNDWYRFVRKERKVGLGNIKNRFTGRGYDNYISMLELWKYPKSEWRERIKECQYITSLLVAKFIDADKIEIPKEWIEGRKKQRVQQMIAKGTNVRHKKLTGEVIGKVAESLERYVSGKSCKFVPIKLQMKDASKNKMFTIYGNADNEPSFQDLFTMVRKDKVRIIIFSDRELKNLKEINLHNWIEIGKFMEGDHKIFRRIVTAYLIHSLYNKYERVFYKKSQLGEISTPIHEKVVKLMEYSDKYYLSGNEAIYQAMLEVAESKKLFDTTIYDVYKEVMFIFDRLPFLNAVFGSMGNYSNEGMIKAARDLFKYYKQRVDWQHYNLPINEEVVTESEIEELAI